jgi:hypothetical protein
VEPLEDKLLTTAEAGRRVTPRSVTAQTIINWTRSRGLPFIRLGPKSPRYIRESDLSAFLESQRITNEPGA